MFGSKQTRRSAVGIETLEGRLLMAVNSWKSAVSGNWNDPTKWSLGHVPLKAEDVEITVAGNYTVTAPVPTSGPGYYEINSFKMTGTGTQVLNLNSVLYSYGKFTVGTGDSINIANGRFLNYAVAGTTHQLDGSINLNGIYGKAAYVNFSSGIVNGTGGVINFVSGGANSVYQNYLNGTNWTLGAGVTLKGKGGNISGGLINKGTINFEGGSTDTFYLQGIRNENVFKALNGTNVQIYDINNLAGKTMNVTGGKFDMRGTYTNAGTIVATNTQLIYGMTFSAIGNVTRTNSPVLFKGTFDGRGGTFALNASTGSWIWSGGRIKNAKYDPSAANALTIDITKGTYGEFENVTLLGNLSIAAGFYINNYGNLTLNNIANKIILNGTASQRSGFYLNTGTLGGSGEVVFNTGGSTAANFLSGTGWTLGSGVLVHGKSGSIGTFTNSGTVIADTANETIVIQGVTNNGSIIAAPGKIQIANFKAGTGALTVGIGGTTAGSSYGQFQFTNSSASQTLGSKFNVVTLNGYAPAAGTSFTAITFVKPPIGTFGTMNLDAGTTKAFDATLSTTSLVVKANTVTSFATRSATGGLTLTGTSGIDTITDTLQGYIHYAVLNGKTSVFFSPQITSLTVNGGDSNDTITNNSATVATLNGGNGDDKLFGGSNADKLDGGAGNDSLVGNAGNDNLIGGEGNDTAVGGSGDDTYTFSNATVAQTDLINEGSGGGSDTLDFGTVTVAVNANLGSDTLATHTNRTMKTQTLGQFANLENLKGGTASDTLKGNSAANKIWGGALNDIIDGLGGNDILTGDAGDDKITGGAGLDSLFGNDGIDTFFAADSEKDTIDGGNALDIVSSSDAVDVKTNI